MKNYWLGQRTARIEAENKKLNIYGAKRPGKYVFKMTDGNEVVIEGSSETRRQLLARLEKARVKKVAERKCNDKWDKLMQEVDFSDKYGILNYNFEVLANALLDNYTFATNSRLADQPLKGDERAAAVKDCVELAKSKLHRFDPKKGNSFAFNFFSTLMLSHLRAIYRVKKVDKI